MIIKRTKNVSGVYSKEKASTVNKEEPIADDGRGKQERMRRCFYAAYACGRFDG